MERHAAIVIQCAAKSTTKILILKRACSSQSVETGGSIYDGAFTDMIVIEEIRQSSAVQVRVTLTCVGSLTHEWCVSHFMKHLVHYVFDLVLRHYARRCLG